MLGKVVGTIPLLGYVSNFVQNPPGTYIAIAAMAILILAVFVPDIIGNAKKLQAEEEEKQKQEESSVDTEKLKAELETLKQQIQQKLEKEGNENEENV